MEDELERESSLRPSYGEDGGGDALQVELQQRYEELIEALILQGQARDLGRTPRFQSQLNNELNVGGSRVSMDLLNKGNPIRTFPNRPAGNMRPMPSQDGVTIEESMKYTGFFIVKGQYQASRDQERLQELRDCEHYLSQDPRFKEITYQVRTLEPGPERIKAVDGFWNTAYSRFQRSERESLSSRGKVLAEYVGLLYEERLRRSLCKRSPGPSHVEDGGGDTQRSANRGHRSSAVIDGPSSLGSSIVGSKSTPGLGLTGTCVTNGHHLQT
jgi:hypothetical protein